MPRWLSFVGPSDQGKTFLAKLIWTTMRPLLSTSHCDYVTSLVYWPGFVDELRAGNAYARARDMRKWPLLVIDDIGAERDTTGFATEQLNTLLGCRTGKWTVLTANLTLEQIAASEPRIASRMIRDGSVAVDLNTTPYSLR